MVLVNIIFLFFLPIFFCHSFFATLFLPLFFAEGKKEKKAKKKRKQKKEKMERNVLIAIIIFLVLAIVYITQKQNFSVYTSGALQRYASEFTSTNQSPQIYTKLAFDPKQNLESELFKSTMANNLGSPIVML
jgi:di/tricarboxylate transporter